MPAKKEAVALSDKQRQKLVEKLATESSNEKLADKFGVSRTTVWRIRHEEAARAQRLRRAESRNKTKVAKEKVGTLKRLMAAPLVDAVVSPPPVPPPPVQMPPAPTDEQDPLPKVDPEPTVLRTYFAVQLLRGEHVKVVAQAVIAAAEASGVLFRKLQVMDFVSVGTSSFVRFRSDLEDVDRVMRSTDRGYIAFSDGAYRITFSDGREGVRFPTTIMLSTQKSGFGMQFAGPKYLRWRSQFSAGS